MTEFDPYLHDPLRWGASMVHHSAALLGCLDAVGAKSVAEVGAYAGDLTRVLVDWADHNDGTVAAVDPVPQPALVKLAEDHDRLDLIRQTSLDALPELPMPDVLIIDGDHNYYTVEQELQAIAKRISGPEMPLLLFHDVAWPHARRDDYYDPEQIPADYRQPILPEGYGISPENPASIKGGLPYPKSAATEGGERNGVLTAVEDFAATSDELELVVVPAFFGFGAIWHRDAPWADAVAAVLKPLDRNPLLQRLESNRVMHIAAEQQLRQQVWDANERLTRQNHLLERLLHSSAFAVAEMLSKLRVRAGVAEGQSVISKDEVREAMHP